MVKGIIDTRTWYTTSQVMNILQFSDIDSVTSKCRDGTFRHMNTGTKKRPRYLIDPESVADWQRSRITGGTKQPAPAQQRWPVGVERHV